MQAKIHPCLWFNDNAKAAVNYYSSVFKNVEILTENNTVIQFTINSTPFTALNGGPTFSINESISFFVYCGSDTEIDRLYTALSQVGTVLMPLGEYPWCKKYAWVKDKFGVSWQLDVDPINSTQTIVPTLLFTNDKFDKVKQASTLYQSVFPESMNLMSATYGKQAQNFPEDTLLFTQFKLNNTIFNALSSPEPHAFDFNEGISFVVQCDTQNEIDKLWNALTQDGGQESQCGWLKDKFGVSWQIIPSILSSLLSDPERAERVTQAFLKMKKMDIETLLQA